MSIFEILILLTISKFCNGFNFVSKHQKNESQLTQLGQNIILRCQVDKGLRTCFWKHNDKSCELTYSKEANDLVKKTSKCSLGNRRLNSIGDYKNHECAIELYNVRLEDIGQWKCSIVEYVSRLNFFRTAEKVVRTIEISLDLTAPISSTTSGPNVTTQKTETETDAHTDPTADQSVNKKNAILTILVILVSSIFVLFMIGVVCYMTRKKTAEVLIGKFARVSGAVRFVEVESRVSVSVPENIEGNEKALEKMGGMEYIGSRRIL